MTTPFSTVPAARNFTVAILRKDGSLESQYSCYHEKVARRNAVEDLAALNEDGARAAVFANAGGESFFWEWQGGRVYPRNSNCFPRSW